MLQGLAVEITILSLLVVQLALLGVGRQGLGGILFIPITYFGYFLAFFVGLRFWNLPAQPLFYEALKNVNLFQTSRIAFVLVGALMVRMALSSKEISAYRKKEVVTIFTLNLLLICLLVLSESLLLSFLILGALGLLGALLVGIPFYDRKESEGAQKNWAFTVAAICFGMGALSVLAILGGGFSYGAIHKIFLGETGRFVFILASLCLIPFFWIGGFFPFHFFAMDRDHSARWPIQAHLGIQVTGGVVLGLVKLLVSLFGGTSYMQGAFCLTLVSFLGVSGAVWGAWGAFSQSGAKRFFAYWTHASWSLVLIPIGLPTALGLTSILFSATVAMLALALMAWGLGRVCERSGTDDFKRITQERHSRFEVGILFFALSSMLVFPPFPGFASFLHLLGASMERGSLLLVALLCLIYLLLVASSLQIYVGFTRQFLNDREPDLAQHKITVMDFCTSVTILLVLAAIGFGWNAYISILLRHAQDFIIS